MRKIIVLMLIIFAFTFLSSSCKGSVSASPPKILITMDKEFINGNTSRVITLTNSNDFDVNLTWYIDYPTPSLIEPNRTAIPDLSWIYLEPRFYDLTPGNTTQFYVYLNIPESEENLNQSWEVWPVFQLGSTGFANQELAVRVFIDTPKKLEIINSPDNDLFSIKIGDQISVPASDIIILAAIISTLTVVYIAIRKKKLQI